EADVDAVQEVQDVANEQDGDDAPDDLAHRRGQGRVAGAGGGERGMAHGCLSWDEWCRWRVRAGAGRRVLWPGFSSFQPPECVTAPWWAEPTRRAYFSSMPLRRAGRGRGCHWRCRWAISA